MRDVLVQRPLIIPLGRFTSLLIDELPAQPVAGVSGRGRGSGPVAAAKLRIDLPKRKCTSKFESDMPPMSDSKCAGRPARSSR
jgi:hypothetical protein